MTIKPYFERDGITIYHGDCLEIMPQLDCEVDAAITDPPYGIDYQSAWRIDSDRFDKISGDAQLDLAWIKLCEAITKKCLFCFCRWDTSNDFYNAITDTGLTIKSQIIWDRVVHGLGDLKAQYAPQHDNAWFATKPCFVFPGNRPKSIYRFMRVAPDKLSHPTEKPIALMKKVINDIAQKNDLILDPFMGSGTTLVAAYHLGRRAIGIELEQKYCDIAIERLRQPPLFT